MVISGVFNFGLLSQLFEFHILYKMVNFQNNIDESELSCKRAEYHEEEKKTTKWYSLNFIFYFFLYPLIAIHFLGIYILLMVTLHRTRYLEYVKLRSSFIAQLISIGCLVGCNTVLYFEWWLNLFRGEAGKLYFYRFWYYIDFVLLTTSFVFVITKPMVDNFALFNLTGQDRTYSSYQYPIKQKEDTYHRILRTQLGLQEDLSPDAL
jgi:hypothetical protein